MLLLLLWFHVNGQLLTDQCRPTDQCRCRCFSGTGAAGIISCQETQNNTMVVPESKDEQTSPSCSVGRSPSQQYRSNQSLPQHSGSSQHFSSNATISPVNTTLDYEPRDYTETDSLLPNEIYSGSKFSGSMKARAPDGADVSAESVCSMVLQILVPFLLAGLGAVFAGLLLDVVQSWDVFQEITEIFILVPAVLGMKGNLEMTLASRLSTAVNAGKMDHVRERWMLITGNLALKQLQATVLGLLASLMATLLGWMAEGKMPFNHVVLLCTTSVSTAFVASLLQGIIMVGVIIGSKRMGINPDNVATPIAASFGDLITLALLASFSIGGNLVSIQSSRISTNLHLNYSPGEVPEDRKHCYNPCRTFFGSGANHRSAQVLLLLVIPGQLIFIHTIHLMKGGHTLPSPLFTVAFLSASLIQVLSLLCTADCMVHCLWRRGKDPDSYSIPYLTALGDLLGTALLSLAFLLLWCSGDSGSV
ncbi:hypothetical protein PAMP_019480 [Pampus punctatissimus]